MGTTLMLGSRRGGGFFTLIPFWHRARDKAGKWSTFWGRVDRRAEEEWRQRTGRALTAAELERLLERYPDDV